LKTLFPGNFKALSEFFCGPLAPRKERRAHLEMRS
jgi:hypothetical protein